MDDSQAAAEAEREVEPPLEVFRPMDTPVADGAVWIDLVNPDVEAARRAHQTCGLRIPSREDLSEIESSSRHFIENDALYLSLPLVAQAESEEADYSPVGLIVTRERLVTIRFDTFKAFELAQERIKTEPPKSGMEAFIIVAEAIVDRQADLLEHLAGELETVSRHVFQGKQPKQADGESMRRLLARIGALGDRNSKLRGTLATLGRLLPFVIETADGSLPLDLDRRLHAAKEDVLSLTSFQDNLANKIQFLLDAALGFISIEQNDVFKILTVVSVVGVPPTLVASIYGMNFKAMPELNWAYGYPYALGLIVLSTVLPLMWFRRKGWF